MAQVYGPLMSESARGQFGEIVIFQEYHGKTYAKGYGKPDWTAHPPTAAQLAVQAMNKSLMKAWPAIAAVDKATWDALAIPDRVSRVNCYLKENFKRLRSGLPATDFWPAVETPPPTTITGDPTPDCTGAYTKIADYNSHDCWERTSDAAYYIFYDSENSVYTISEIIQNLPPDGWTKTTNYENAPGDYEPIDTYTGTPTVNLP